MKGSSEWHSYAFPGRDISRRGLGFLPPDYDTLRLTPGPRII